MNATAAALLGLLDEGGDMTGGELLRVAEVRIGNFWTLARSQVYRELRALADDGYVAPGAPGPRDAQPFRLTPAGRAAYRSWLRDELPTAETIRQPLLLAVAFGRVLGAARLAELLATAEAASRRRLAEYRSLDRDLAAADVDPHVRATLSFGLHYEEAVQRWFAALPPEVRRASAEEADSVRRSTSERTV